MAKASKQRAKWFHVYLDSKFHATVRGGMAHAVARKYLPQAQQVVNVTAHDTGEEVMIAKATQQ
jgi:hypothetical protein